MPPEAQPLLLRFIEARLITSRALQEDKPDSERVIEVAHEALLRSWPELTNWLDARRDLLRWRADVERDMARDGQKWSGLNARQFATGRDLQRRFPDDLTDSERGSIRRAASRARNRRLFAYAIAGVFAALAVTASLFKLNADAQKRQVQIVATDSLLKVGRTAIQYEHDVPTAALWFAQALRSIENASPERRFAARSLLGGWNTQVPRYSLLHDDPVMAVAFSPGGHTLATASGSTARLWDAQTGQPRVHPLKHFAGVFSVSFSPDGRTLATASGDKTARLWDAQTGQPRAEPFKHDDSVEAMSSSPNGRMLATASRDHMARLWDVPLPVPDQPERVWLAVEVRTAHTIENGLARLLTVKELEERKNQLEALGGDCLRRKWEDLTEQEKRELRTPGVD
jgi:WD40 repeat protein